MGAKAFILNKAVVYREAGNETIVIHVDSGHFYYYSKATKTFLDFFRTPQTLSSVEKALGKPDNADVNRQLKDLFDKKILSEAPPATSTSGASSEKLPMPEFLRTGEKTLDQIAFLS